MIYIPLDGLVPPGDWVERAQAVTQQMEEAADDAARHQIIDDNETLWGELKGWLLTLSKGKCWFSEAREIYSHFDVEHFRPKKSAKNADKTDRGGYWWLTFDWLNYRICGNVGNRKKGTYFPLAPTSTIATAANRAAVEDELNLFLDPTVEEDPVLLSFNEVGEAESLGGTSAWDQERVAGSILRFKLNEHPQLLEARRDLWQRCRGKVAECQNLMVKPATVARRERIKAKIHELRAFVRSDAVLSATARECLRKSNVEWAIRIAGNN
jgi:hypothetical protein